MRFGPFPETVLVAYISLQLKGGMVPVGAGGTQPTSLENNDFRKEGNPPAIQ